MKLLGQPKILYLLVSTVQSNLSGSATSDCVDLTDRERAKDNLPKLAAAVVEDFSSEF
jgi:hypothetical protein